MVPYDLFYRLADPASEKAYIQCVHSIDVLHLAAGMLDVGVDVAQKLFVSW
jgi:hypothetical protein